MNKEIHNKNNAYPIAFVDIDETICFYEGDRVYELATPSRENIQKINKLYDEGWIITYWTARGSSDPTNKERMEESSINFKAIKGMGSKVPQPRGWR